MNIFSKITMLSIAVLFAATTIKAQDIIVLKGKTADEIKVKVTEVTGKNVKYKKWSYQEGPTFSLSVDEILIIKYQNGEEQLFSRKEKVALGETKTLFGKISKKVNKSKDNKGLGKADKKNKISKKSANKASSKIEDNNSWENLNRNQKQSQELDVDNIPTKSNDAPSSYPQKDVAETKTKTSEFTYAKGQNKFSIEAIYYSPTDKVDGFNSFALEWDLTFGKYFLDKLFADVGIGVISSSTSNGSAIHKIATSNTGISMPIRIGYSLPITEKIIVDFKTGPKLGYTLAGKSINGEDVKKLKDMENVERFSVNWDLSASVNLWGVSVGAKYMLGLTEDGSMWGVFIGFGF